MDDRRDTTNDVRDYVRQRMSSEMPPDFVDDVMHEVRDTPQRRRWAAWPVVASLATVAAAAAVVGIGLSMVQPGGVGSGSASPTPTASHSGMPDQSLRPDPSQVPNGPHGPVWQAPPFTGATSCENPAGLPTAEEGENVAWRIAFPSDWTTRESYLGPCLWFGPQPWDPDLENPIPPDEVAIVISLLDQRVTPGAAEFESGTVTAEARYTVDGLPAVRYAVNGASGELLRGDGVIWVIGVEGELPTFDGGPTPNWMTLYTLTSGTGRLIQQVETLDRMVATLAITDR